MIGDWIELEDGVYEREIHLDENEYFEVQVRRGVRGEEVRWAVFTQIENGTPSFGIPETTKPTLEEAQQAAMEWVRDHVKFMIRCMEQLVDEVEREISG